MLCTAHAVFTGTTVVSPLIIVNHLLIYFVIQTPFSEMHCLFSNVVALQFRARCREYQGLEITPNTHTSKLDHL